MKPHIIKGDTVKIRRGKERGKQGTVKAVFAASGMATVQGVNIVKRHTKQGSQSGNVGKSTATGGIIEKESPLPLSALQYVCEKCKTPARLRRGRATDGAVHRICARCNEPARESVRGA